MASLGIATLNISLLLLCQSRGSVPAIALAVLVYLLFAPLRLRALVVAHLAILPAIGVVPALDRSLYDGYRRRACGRRSTRHASPVSQRALCAAVAVVLAALAIGVETRLPDRGANAARSNRAVARRLAAVLAAGAVAFVVATGNPVDWLNERIDEVRAGGGEPANEGNTRFTVDAGSNRYDLWRVALDDAAEDPLLGDGAGGFQYTYLQKRDVARQDALDAHSIELETLAELGIPGLVLLLSAIARCRLRRHTRTQARAGDGRPRRDRAGQLRPTGWCTLRSTGFGGIRR